MKKQNNLVVQYDHPEMCIIPLLPCEPLCSSGTKESFIVDSEDIVEF